MLSFKPIQGFWRHLMNPIRHKKTMIWSSSKGGRPQLCDRLVFQLACDSGKAAALGLPLRLALTGPVSGDDCWASSGQISCQSSGRKSLRVTAPFVSLSIATQSFSPGMRWPYITFRRNGQVVPHRAAKLSRSLRGIDLRKCLSLSIQTSVHRLVKHRNTTR